MVFFSFVLSPVSLAHGVPRAEASCLTLPTRVPGAETQAATTWAQGCVRTSGPRHTHAKMTADAGPLSLGPGGGLGAGCGGWRGLAGAGGGAAPALIPPRALESSPLPRRRCLGNRPALCPRASSCLSVPSSKEKPFLGFEPRWVLVHWPCEAGHEDPAEAQLGRVDAKSSVLAGAVRP